MKNILLVTNRLEKFNTIFWKTMKKFCLLVEENPETVINFLPRDRDLDVIIVDSFSIFPTSNEKDQKKFILSLQAEKEFALSLEAEKSIVNILFYDPRRENGYLKSFREVKAKLSDFLKP